MSLARDLAAAMARPAAAPPFAGDDWDGGGDAPPVPAAVLVAITDRPDPGVILTRRADTLRTHGGQVAFPGGRIDAGDADPVAAALREAEEEIALDPAAATVVGCGDVYRTVTGYAVVPVVAVVPPDLPLHPSEAEVAALFEPPLAHLLDPAAAVERRVLWQGRERRYREIMWGGERIWGATAAILANLAARLRRSGS